MNWQKRAQSGAAILVALLAALIIIYVLFLPVEERAALLGTGSPGTTPNPDGSPKTALLVFTSFVGRVYLPGVPAIDHDLPSMSIRTVESGNVVASADTVIARNNAFEKQTQTLTFLADPAQTRNAVLSMNLVAKTGGRVRILLNDAEVFNQDVRTRSIPPIPLNNLQTYNNLTFEATTVGFAFWKTNTYTLSTVKVTADVTDVSAASSRGVISLDAEEFATLENAQLSFIPICYRDGDLRIVLNSVELYSGIPDCGALNTIELAPTRLNAGENSVQFSTTNGDFLIDRGLVRTEGMEVENRVFHFTLDPAKAQGKQVNLRILFADAATHTGSILINGNDVPLRAQDTIILPITSYVRPGDNALSFEAVGKDFEVVKIDVLLV